MIFCASLYLISTPAVIQLERVEGKIEKTTLKTILILKILINIPN